MRDIREIVRPDVESDRRFAAVARISEINLSLYRNFVQPWVRAAVTPQSASLMTRLHPLRVTYELASDRNPRMGWIAGEAQKVRENRKPVSPDNPFLREQEKFHGRSKRRSINGVNGVTACMSRRSMPCTDLPGCRPGREWMQGTLASPVGIPATHPSIERSWRGEAERLRREIAKGGLIEAGLRALYYIDSRGWFDERGFNLIRRLREENGANFRTISSQFKQAVRQQARIMRLDAVAAIAALPQLLSRAAPADIELLGSMARSTSDRQWSA